MTEHETMAAARTAFIVAWTVWLRTKPPTATARMECQIGQMALEMIRFEEETA